MDTSRSMALAERYWQWRLDTYPEHATIYGYPGDHGSWTDMTVDAIASRKRWMGSFLEEVRASDEQSLNQDLLDYEISSRVEQMSYPAEYLAVTPMGGPHTVCAQILALMPKATTAQHDDIHSRLESFPGYLEQAVDLLREGLAQGITQPQVVLRDVPDQIDIQITEDGSDIAIVQALGEVPQSLKSEAAEIYRGKILPAMKRYRAFVADEYIPKVRTSIALSDLDNGSEWYASLVRYFTTTDVIPQQVHEVGLGEVDRIRGLMQSIVDEEGYASFEDFTRFLRDDPSFYFTTAEDLLVAYRDICKRADPELARLFKTLPRLPYGVLPVPSYIEKTTTTAYYQRGAPDIGRAGYFYANTYNLPARPKWEMEALSLHEAVPGHHLQLALASELKGVPAFRRHFILTAYTEGWGLYAESLGEEMGFYRDPYSRFGQLTYEMWRAIRLVVDTGMHALGWSREQAIDYFVTNTGKAEHDIVVEVDRYISWPGQALAYKTGELKIKQLRRMAEDVLGERFDIREFHEQVLNEGALPLTILEHRIGDWMAGKSA